MGFETSREPFEQATADKLLGYLVEYGRKGRYAWAAPASYEQTPMVGIWE